MRERQGLIGPFCDDRDVMAMQQQPRSARAAAAPAWWLTGPGALVSAAAIAGLLRVVYGAGFVTHDTLWALAWGRDIAGGDLLSASGTTTPHVLSNAVGALLSPLGADADIALILLSFWAAGGLVLVAGLLTSELAGAGAGVAAAVLVASREQLLHATTASAIDVWTALLVCWGLLLLVRHRRAGREGAPASAVALLLLAGLLRPEPWLLSAMLWVWLVVRSRRGDGDGSWHPVILALTLAAPLSWFAADQIFAGDLLFSIHETTRVNDAFDAEAGARWTFAERLIDGPAAIVRAAGIELVVAALLAGAAAVTQWRKRPPLTGPDHATLLVAATLTLWIVAMIGESIGLGATMYARFALPVAVLTAALGIAAAAELLQRSFLRGRQGAALAGITAALLLLHAPWVLGARGDATSENARYWSARGVLTDGVGCTPVEVSAVFARVYVVVWAQVTPPEVTVAPGSPLVSDDWRVWTRCGGS